MVNLELMTVEINKIIKKQPQPDSVYSEIYKMKKSENSKEVHVAKAFISDKEAPVGWHKESTLYTQTTIHETIIVRHPMTREAI